MIRRPAFTIIECLVSLAITCLLAVLISFHLHGLKTITNEQSERPLDWCICLTELESADHRFVLKKVKRHALRVKSLNSGLTYELLATDRLYLRRAEHGGYLLLFSDVYPNSVSFEQLSATRVEITGKRKNGQQLTGRVNFYEEQTNQQTVGIRAPG